MTVIRYRCTRHPHVGRALGGSPTRSEVCRLVPADTAPRRPAPSVPRTLSRPPARMGWAHPLLHPAAPPSAAQSEPPSSGVCAGRALEGLRILVVEDDDDARELVGIILSGAGAVVECAASAAEGYRILGVTPAQLLVSDIGMPDEDGYSLMRRIRALECSQGGDIPSIALSAFTRPEDRMRALRAGFTTHIAKPVHPSQLVSALATLAALIGHRPQPSAANSPI